MEFTIIFFEAIVEIEEFPSCFLNVKIWGTCSHSTCFTGYGRRDVVELLLASGASIQARDDGGLHPLHNACSFGHADVVRLLLEAGANPNTRDNWNYTPLHEAAIKGKVDVCIGRYYIFFKHYFFPGQCNLFNNLFIQLYFNMELMPVYAIQKGKPPWNWQMLQQDQC